MQIDFHHTVTYVTSRLAGFGHKDADVIAYAAQYVDDATSSGAVIFSNKALYTRISSAHQSLDLENLNDVENHLVWLPFHFFPGNGGLPAGQTPDGSFINRLICKPDSPPAREMLAAAFKQKGNANALHRLGVALHVYADTWAHQGFAGVLHEVNEVEDAKEIDGKKVFGNLQEKLFDLVDDALPPLGHARANVFPDMPFLNWQYENGHDEVPVKRDNTNLFCQAADALCKAMQRYLGSDETGLSGDSLDKIRSKFETLADEDGDERHKKWLDAINDGEFFAMDGATLSYAADGKNSWKARALGTSCDRPVHTYSEAFLASDWKMFHDALQQHRLEVLHDILPRYGICAG